MKLDLLYKGLLILLFHFSCSHTPFEVLTDPTVEIYKIETGFARLTSGPTVVRMKPSEIAQAQNLNLYIHLKTNYEQVRNYYEALYCPPEGPFCAGYRLPFTDIISGIEVIDLNDYNENFPKDQGLNPIVNVTPAPEIDSGKTFAKYQLSVDEFLKQHENGYGGDLFLTFSEDPQLNVRHRFYIELRFTNGKVLSAKTDEIEFKIR